ncbi:MAG: hypothetical protein KF891_09395 [Rhizobacter sp.]|nr:hypothetical protein [Rhizobacter sp.]
MSNALFLPRELFDPAPAPAGQTASPRPPQGGHFTSGEAVAADLLQSLQPAPHTVPTVPTERRRTPRPSGLRGVDLYIA